jgi:hypothetical protein
MIYVRAVVAFATLVFLGTVQSLLPTTHGLDIDMGMDRGIMSKSAATGPSTGQQVTVVIMNWQRPDTVIHIARVYVKFETIAEIIIWMCHPDTK